MFFNYQYKSPEKLKHNIRREFNRLIKLDLIETGESQYSNAYLPVAKFKEGKLSLCLVLDLRHLNKGCEVDRLPIQDINDLCKWLSTDTTDT